MTARFFAAIAAAYQSLQQKLDDYLPTHASVEAVPGVGAALRHAVSAHLPEGWAIVRGYVSLAGCPSPLLEGMLIDLKAELLFHSPDLVVARPEAVHGIIQVLPPQSERALPQLVELAAHWRQAIDQAQAPVVGVLAQAPEQSRSWLEALVAQTQQQATRSLDAVALGADTHLELDRKANRYRLMQWRSKRGKAPEKPLALAYTLSHLLRSLPTYAQESLSWGHLDGFQRQELSALELSSDIGHLPSSLSQPELPQPVAVHDHPGQGAQATATAHIRTQSVAQKTPAKLSRQEHQAIHTPDQSGYYPLHRAVLDQQADRISQLIEQGAVPEVKDKDGNTPLHLAVMAGEKVLLETLLQHGADPNNRNYLATAPLHLAIEEKQAELARLLIQYGAELEARNNRGKTPLHLAAINGALACAEVLHQAQANLEATMEKGMRPLHLAAWYGQSEVAQFLIDLGADIDATNTDGNTPLHFAAFNGQVKLIKVLINNRADMRIANQAGETYLQGINEGYQGEMIAVLE
jgi:ankyrin repeat protein